MPSSRYLQTNELTAIRALPLTIHMYTTDPTSSDVGVEVVGGGYLPQTITFGVPVVVGSGTEMTNDAVVTFPTPSADWSGGTPVSHFGIRSGGNLIHYAPLTSLSVALPRVVRFGDVFQIPIGICKIRKPD